MKKCFLVFLACLLAFSSLPAFAKAEGDGFTGASAQGEFIFPSRTYDFETREYVQTQVTLSFDMILNTNSDATEYEAYGKFYIQADNGTYSTMETWVALQRLYQQNAKQTTITRSMEGNYGYAVSRVNLGSGQPTPEQEELSQMLMKGTEDYLTPVYENGVYTLVLDDAAMKKFLQVFCTNYMEYSMQKLAEENYPADKQEAQKQLDEIFARLQNVQILGEDGFLLEMTEDGSHMHFVLEIDLDEGEVAAAITGEERPSKEKRPFYMRMELTVDVLKSPVQIDFPALTKDNTYLSQGYYMYGPNIYFEGYRLSVQPVERFGTILVALRPFAMQIGAYEEDIAYADGQATVRLYGHEMIFTEGSKTALLDGVETPLDEPAENIDGTLYVPLRFLCEAIGYEVRWTPIYEENGEYTGTSLVQIAKPGNNWELLVPDGPMGEQEWQMSQTNFVTRLDSLIMGTDATFSPFAYRENGEIMGIDVELGQAIARDAAKVLVVDDMDFDKLFAALRAGEVDMVIAGLSTTQERRQSFAFSVPYYSESQVALVSRDEGGVKNLEDLAGKKIGVIKGTSGDFAASAIENAEITRFETKEAACAALKKGGIDAAVVSGREAAALMQADSRLTQLGGALCTDEFCVAVRKGDTQFLNAINATIEKMQSDGSLEEIVQRHMRQSGAEKAEKEQKPAA